MGEPRLNRQGRRLSHRRRQVPPRIERRTGAMPPATPAWRHLDKSGESRAVVRQVVACVRQEEWLTGCLTIFLFAGRFHLTQRREAPWTTSDALNTRGV